MGIYKAVKRDNQDHAQPFHFVPDEAFGDVLQKMSFKVYLIHPQDENNTWVFALRGSGTKK